MQSLKRAVCVVGYIGGVSATAQSLLSAKRALNVWRSVTAPLYWAYERQLLGAIRRSGALPKHIGIIMDGNRRFARTVGLDVKAGHDYGAGKAREVLDWCLDLNIQHVTLWGFSTENKGRKPEEVAHAVLFLASEGAEFSTGAIIDVNGASYLRT